MRLALYLAIEQFRWHPCVQYDESDFLSDLLIQNRAQNHRILISPHSRSFKINFHWREMYK
ncbi:hypothetical protein AAZX31_18G096800 [Glycine max]